MKKKFQSEDLVSSGIAAQKGDRISTLKNFQNLAGLWATQISFEVSQGSNRSLNLTLSAEVLSYLNFMNSSLLT